jgi:hypothetical protein
VINMCAKTGKYWDQFIEWAKAHAVEFRHEDDLETWWRCWYDAIQSVTAEHQDEKIPVA